MVDIRIDIWAALLQTIMDWLADKRSPSSQIQHFIDTQNPGPHIDRSNHRL